MSISIQGAKFDFVAIVENVRQQQRAADSYREIYSQNCHRVYSLAFYMTDNELAAEQLSKDTFLRAFAGNAEPSPENIDRALVTELREYMPLGNLTLEAPPATEVVGLRRTQTKRVIMERAVVSLPATERMVFLLHDVESYEHVRIARTLGITEQESRHALHAARMRVRELMAQLS
jgi:RNA polymerase sigma-70 factor, ECF subfamily